jgi:hypothetical protein
VHIPGHLAGRPVLHQRHHSRRYAARFPRKSHPVTSPARAAPSCPTPLPAASTGIGVTEVLQPGSGFHVHVSLTDPSGANPYLGMAAIGAAVYLGLTGKISPPEPLTGYGYAPSLPDPPDAPPRRPGSFGSRHRPEPAATPPACRSPRPTAPRSLHPSPHIAYIPANEARGPAFDRMRVAITRFYAGGCHIHPLK